MLLSACSEQRSSFLDPGGPIAAAQRAHMIEVVGWTMIAVLPVFVLVPLMLWRYRYRNDKARYTPDWEFSGWLDLLMWGVPFIIVVVLSSMLWKSTHALDPYKPIASAEAPLEVQVIGLDWKWLFIYPELGIATVNEMAFPVGTSVSFVLTADTVMQSFVIAALAGQIYVMPGMRTQLHVLADEPGDYEGENMQFNGLGFTKQKFRALAMTPADFSAWVEEVRSHGVALDEATYGRLAVASTGTQAHDTLGSPQMPADALYFNAVEAALFEGVLHRYMRGTAVPPALQPGAVGYLPPPAPTGESQ
ncbi:cytochrome ubiquinol oxidase subunit II [Roseovarius sp. M141]|uniref:cytochrome ubiquinol oxidase subunit II n=1 Tax=Roseovarius sp. M141 TaxID=2583806 RepID=UPI0020CD77A4|nr:cytochrome ubiquinol oxidase subunit II [Roseovarius sp. M141]